MRARELEGYEGAGALRETLQLMKEFMMSRKVPLTLQGKIKRYLEFQHRSKKAGSIDRHQVLDQPPGAAGLLRCPPTHLYTLSSPLRPARAARTHTA